MVGGKDRWALIPQVPSAVEAGMPDVRISSWNGVVGPAKLPSDVLDRLTRAFNEGANSPEVKGKLEATGWVIRAENSAQMAQTIRADTELFRPVIKEANIKLDQ
jgi:tripartite-type tricarboxylate transporter receptor subunit TctC